MFGAGDEARTRDIQFGKLKLYQLSYTRVTVRQLSHFAHPLNQRQQALYYYINITFGGGGRIRTFVL